jgi:hypothetical protein
MNTNIMQIVEQTDEEKLTMYMKCKKEQLAKMLIQCNKIIDSNIFPYVSSLDYYNEKPNERFLGEL